MLIIKIVKRETTEGTIFGEEESGQQRWEKKPKKKTNPEMCISEERESLLHTSFAA